MFDANIASDLKRIISNPFFIQQESQHGRAKGKSPRQISSRKTDCIHDLQTHFQVAGAHDAVLDLTDSV